MKPTEKNDIVLNFLDIDTEECLFETTLAKFIEVNNYDDLDKDIEKIKKAKIGDKVIVDFQHIIQIGES